MRTRPARTATALCIANIGMAGMAHGGVVLVLQTTTRPTLYKLRQTALAIRVPMQQRILSAVIIIQFYFAPFSGQDVVFVRRESLEKNEKNCKFEANMK